MLASFPAHRGEVGVCQLYRERGRPGRARTVRVDFLSEPRYRRPLLLRWACHRAGLDSTPARRWLHAQHCEIRGTVVEVEDMLDVVRPMTSIVLDIEVLTRRFDLVGDATAPSPSPGRAAPAGA